MFISETLHIALLVFETSADVTPAKLFKQCWNQLCSTEHLLGIFEVQYKFYTLESLFQMKVCAILKLILSHGCDKNGIIMCTKSCNLVAGDFSVSGGAKLIISQLSLNWALWTDTKHILSSEHLFSALLRLILSPLEHMVVKCVVLVCVLYWFLGRSFSCISQGVWFYLNSPRYSDYTLSDPSPLARSPLSDPFITHGEVLHPYVAQSCFCHLQFRLKCWWNLQLCKNFL